LVLWDVATLKRINDEPLSLNDEVVQRAAFSPDGKTIAVGFKSGVVLWDLASCKRLTVEPLSMDGTVECVEFSPDGNTIAVGYQQERGRTGVVLLDIDLESWKRRASQIANRNFTRKEWREYFPDEPYRATFPDLPVPAEEPPK
jgi:WD40 repeat protein